MKNGLLSQWRGYAGVGGGYCVVLDEAALDLMVEEEKQASPDITILKKDVVYVGEEEPIPEPRDRVHLLDVLAFLKSQSFAEEHETRIMLSSPPQKPRKIRFRESGDLLIPYVEIFGKPRRLPITEIIVGPGPPFSDAARRVWCNSSGRMGSGSRSGCRIFHWPDSRSAHLQAKASA